MNPSKKSTVFSSIDLTRNLLVRVFLFGVVALAVVVLGGAGYGSSDFCLFSSLDESLVISGSTAVFTTEIVASTTEKVASTTRKSTSTSRKASFVVHDARVGTTALPKLRAPGLVTTSADLLSKSIQFWFESDVRPSAIEMLSTTIERSDEKETKTEKTIEKERNCLLSSPLLFSSSPLCSSLPFSPPLLIPIA